MIHSSGLLLLKPFHSSIFSCFPFPSGANPTLRDPSKGFTALQWAQYCGRNSTVEEMIKLLGDDRLVCCKSLSASSKELPADEDSLIGRAVSASALCASSILPLPASVTAKNQSGLPTLDRRKSLSVPQIIITQSSSSSSEWKMGNQKSSDYFGRESDYKLLLNSFYRIF